MTPAAHPVYAPLGGSPTAIDWSDIVPTEEDKRTWALQDAHYDAVTGHRAEWHHNIDCAECAMRARRGGVTRG